MVFIFANECTRVAMATTNGNSGGRVVSMITFLSYRYEYLSRQIRVHKNYLYRRLGEETEKMNDNNNSNNDYDDNNNDNDDNNNRKNDNIIIK